MIYKPTIFFYLIAFSFRFSNQAPLNFQEDKTQSESYPKIADISRDEIKIMEALEKFLTWYKAEGNNNQEEVFAAPQLRQHWSYGFAPGGKKRSSLSLTKSAVEEGLTSAQIYEIVSYFLENSRENKYPLAGIQARQHWSNSWQPGGKRSLPDYQANEEKRQHWSFGYGPGGKRSVHDESDLEMQNK